MSMGWPSITGATKYAMNVMAAVATKPASSARGILLKSITFSILAKWPWLLFRGPARAEVEAALRSSQSIQSGGMRRYPRHCHRESIRRSSVGRTNSDRAETFQFLRTQADAHRRPAKRCGQAAETALWRRR